MSEFAPSFVAGSMPGEAGLVSAKPVTETPDDSEVSDFALLFENMNFASITPDDPPMDSSTDVSLSPDAVVINSLAVTENLTSSDVEPLLPENLQPGGNLLPLSSPVVGINGFGIQTDQDGATAIAVQGDSKNIMNSNLHHVNAVVPAIQQTQTQLYDMVNAHTMLNQDVEMSAVSKLEMGKQIEMLGSLTQQNTATPADALINPDRQPPTHALIGLLGATEFSNVLGTSTRMPEPMSATLNQPQWNQQIGDRINWMISQGLRQADIRLNPPELGMLEVRVQMQGDQASIQFNTAHAEVKDALESAMPRLREMLAANGLDLADVNVSHQGQQQAKHGEESRSSQPAYTSQSESEQTIENQATKSFLSKGIIDFYA